MGQMRLYVGDRSMLDDARLALMYVAGFEEVPWPTDAQWDDDDIVLTRSVGDSGSVYCPWPVGGRALQMLSTGCLMERERPYILTVELARGTLHRIRSQVAACVASGCDVPDDVASAVTDAMRRLGRAVALQHQPDTASTAAHEAVDLAVDIDARLSRHVARSALDGRQENQARLNTLLGVHLGSVPLDASTAAQVAGAFNSAVVPLGWRELEVREGQHDWSLADRQIHWCHTLGMRICAGPLLQLDGTGMPDWLVLWSGDFARLLSLVMDHVRDVVARYRGRVHVWHVVSRVNATSLLDLTLQQRAEVVWRAVEMVRRLDGKTPITVSFDQPWGEYMTRTQVEASPIHLADALLRAPLGINGIGLECNVGYFPGGTLPRSELAFGRQLERWSVLGKPLLVMLTHPGGCGGPDDPVPATTTVRRAWMSPPDKAAGVEAQRQWVERYVPLALAAPSVQAIIWNQLRDTDKPEFLTSGLIDEHGKSKPALGCLRRIRQEYLL